MKEIIEKYIHSSDENEVVMEEKIVRQGFDFIERRAAWTGIMADTFAEIDKEEAPKTQTRRLWQYAAAAGVLLLVAIGIWAISSQNTGKKAPKPYIQQGNGGDKSQLVADALTHIDKLLTQNVDDFQATVVRKGKDDTDDWQTGFQSGKYADVITKLEKVGHKRTIEQTYFLAQAYLKIDPKNTLKAQPLFKEVSLANSDNAQDALWSYALICLLHQQNDLAKIALDEVIEKSIAHKVEAQKLRLDLK
jgi:hypothetical protein